MYIYHFSISCFGGGINAAIEGNTFLCSINPRSTSHSKSQKYVDYIEHMHPN